jgi:hypothetical protein
MATSPSQPAEISNKKDITSSNPHPVCSKQYRMLLPSGVGDVPTLSVHLDVWDHVESYTIRMLLACRLKIIPTSNLKLIISFLVLPLVLLHSYKPLSFVASTRHAPLTLHVYLRLAIRPSADIVYIMILIIKNSKDMWDQDLRMRELGAQARKISEEKLKPLFTSGSGQKRTQGKSLWNLDGMKYFHRAGKNGGKYLIVRMI